MLSPSSTSLLSVLVLGSFAHAAAALARLVQREPRLGVEADGWRGGAGVHHNQGKKINITSFFDTYLWPRAPHGAAAATTTRAACCSR
tara:strand:- start:7 stop:270 length:264 start_codon:yes stop_codon:yes gene_type:complete